MTFNISMFFHLQPLLLENDKISKKYEHIILMNSPTFICINISFVWLWLWLDNKEVISMKYDQITLKYDIIQSKQIIKNWCLNDCLLYNKY